MARSRRSSTHSFRSRASSAHSASIEVAEEKFILNTRATMMFSVFGAVTAVLLIAGLVRSAIALASILNNLATLKNADASIGSFRAIELMADLIYKESFARVKYLSSGLSPTYFAEMTMAVNDIDQLFNSHAKEFQRIFFNAAEYRIYNCSLLGIKSNLEQRASAIPLSHHRTLDERTLNAFDDADFYECLLVQLAEIQGQVVANAPGFEDLWQSAVAYFMSLRSVVNLQVALNYAFLTRELVINKGSVVFAREKDGVSLDDALSMSQVLILRAEEMTPANLGTAGKPAVENLNYLVEQFTDIENATKALILVAREKFEPSSIAKATLGYLQTVKDDFRNHLMSVHSEAVQITYLSVVSEAIKLFIFLLVLPPLVLRCIFHMKMESSRLQVRYDKSAARYVDSCKAIFRLLPEPVAKKLNLGLHVHPEFFHNATVFYSDIVGFTMICSKLTAIEVLAMLNTIYTTFDSRTNAYKCYKIETIGDAYVVASGVPTRNTTHASEIAALALVLVEEVGMIKIPHSNQRIRIRVGINSGPVIAGIVGIKMLRYCLFGKTVLYANRMEQSSQPQKIQISQTSYNELLNQGGFLLNERPKEEWPDETPTYWLTGRTTTTVPLSMFSSPDSDMGNTEVALAAN